MNAAATISYTLPDGWNDDSEIEPIAVGDELEVVVDDTDYYRRGYIFNVLGVKDAPNGPHQKMLCLTHKIGATIETPWPSSWLEKVGKRWRGADTLPYDPDFDNIDFKQRSR